MSAKVEQFLNIALLLFDKNLQQFLNLPMSFKSNTLLRMLIRTCINPQLSSVHFNFEKAKNVQKLSDL